MKIVPEYFPNLDRFEWDSGNDSKNWDRHSVSQAEAEQVFLNRPILVIDTTKPDKTESRNVALGKTDNGRQLFVVFTIRKSKIRIVSARPMSRKERGVYGKA